MPPFHPQFTGDRQLFNGSQQPYPYPYVSQSKYEDKMIAITLFYEASSLRLEEVIIEQSSRIQQVTILHMFPYHFYY